MCKFYLWLLLLLKKAPKALIDLCDDDASKKKIENLSFVISLLATNITDIHLSGRFLIDDTPLLYQTCIHSFLKLIPINREIYKSLIFIVISCDMMRQHSVMCREMIFLRYTHVYKYYKKMYIIHNSVAI